MDNREKISLNQTAIISFSQTFDTYTNKFKEYFKVKGEECETN